MVSKELKRMVLGLAILLPLSAFAYFAAFWLRFDGQINELSANLIVLTLGWVLAVKTLCISLARLHQEYSRYVSFRDMLVLARTVTLSTVGIVLVDTLLLTSVTIPRSVVLLDWGMTLALLILVRTAPRFPPRLSASIFVQLSRNPSAHRRCQRRRRGAAA